MKKDNNGKGLVGVMTPMRSNKLVTDVMINRKDLTNYTLSDLAAAYAQVDGMTALLKGQILLEARRKCGNNDMAFGKWVKDNNLDAVSQQTRHKYMTLAKHFSADRETKNLTPTVCIEIATALERDRTVGEEAYYYALQHQPSKKALKEKIAQLRGDVTPAVKIPVVFQDDAGFTLPEDYEVKRGVRSVTFIETTPEDSVLYALEKYGPQEKLDILNRCKELIEATLINNV